MNHQKPQGGKQVGIVLLATLLFILMISSIAAVVAYQTTLGPRTLANAELKTLTFYEAQGVLEEVNTLDLEAHSCTTIGRYEEFDPLAKTPESKCSPSDEAPHVRLIAENAQSQRTGDSGGVNQTRTDYFETEVVRSQSGISTTLRQNHYKTLWQAGETGTNSAGIIDVTVTGSSNKK